MLAAVQFVQDKNTKTFFDTSIKIAPKITANCYQKGLIARPLPSVDSVAFSPPLVTDDKQVNDIVDIFEEAVREVMDKLI